MSTLQGNAKRYDGSSIDYVLIFDWANGDCIGTAIPNASGVWTYDYFQDMTVGITYVASGCEPITHGAYEFVAEIAELYGYILLAFASSGSGRYLPHYDKTNTTYSTWPTNFEKVLSTGFGVQEYETGASFAKTTYKIAVIPIFNINWVLDFYGYSASQTGSRHNFTLEILDENDVVLFAMQTKMTRDFNAPLAYGPNLDSLTDTGYSGVRVTQGTMSFTNAGVIYENTRGSNYNKSFTFAVDLTQARKIRVGGDATSDTSSQNDSGIRIFLRPPAPVQ